MTHKTTLIQTHMSTSYQATPYYVVEHPNGWTIQTRENGVGACVAQQYADSSIGTARFIVSACNHHNRLVTSLQRLLERYERDHSDTASGTVPYEVAVARETLASLGLHAPKEPESKVEQLVAAIFSDQVILDYCRLVIRYSQHRKDQVRDFMSKLKLKGLNLPGATDATLALALAEIERVDAAK